MCNGHCAEMSYFFIIAFTNETIGGCLRYSQIVRSHFLKFGLLEDITCKLWIEFYNTVWNHSCKFFMLSDF